MKPSVRPARLADLDAVAEASASRPTAAGWTRAQFAREVENPRSRFLVAEEGGEFLGYAIFVLAPEEAQIVDVVVRADRSRRGTGRVLLEAAFSEARNLGCLKATLEVGAKNEAALALYRSLGFAVVGRRPKFYNDGSDAVLMDRKLP